LFNRLFNRVSFSQVVIMTRQLATMIEAGLVLSEALDILEEQQTSKVFKQVLKEISDDVKGGLDFASALDKHPTVFPKIYANLVRAGEASGKLDTILLQLATNLEKEREFKSKVRGAMIYPIIVITMMVGVMLVTIFFVMPRLLGLFTQSNIELPLPTKILIMVSSAMLNFWWIILILIGLIIFAFRRLVATESGRLMVDTKLLQFPVLGKIISVVSLTNFTRTFGLLVAAGIPILDAIRVVADVAGNSAYKNALDTASKGVERGLTFSSQLLSQPIFPRIVGQMIRTGEETGKLDEIMFKLADYFESESDNALKNITTLIEPVVLILLGVGTAFMVLSIILPIYSLTTAVQ